MKTIAAIALASLAACAAADPSEGAYDTDGDGKADGTSIKKRRRLSSRVTCPDGNAKFKVAFFDADSTLRVSKSGEVTANSPTDVNVLPFAGREMARLESEGYVIAIVSNQGGISAGHTTLETAEKALALTISKLHAFGAHVHYFDFAERNDEFRKPSTGMADLLATKLDDKCGVGFDKATSLMVGDSGYKKGVDGPHPDGRPADDFSNADRFFAVNVGIDFHEPTDYFDWRAYDVFNIASQAELVSFLDAIDARADMLEAMNGDPAEIEALRTEAQRNRQVNDL